MGEKRQKNIICARRLLSVYMSQALNPAISQEQRPLAACLILLSKILIFSTILKIYICWAFNNLMFRHMLDGRDEKHPTFALLHVFVISHCSYHRLVGSVPVCFCVSECVSAQLHCGI